MCILPNRIHRRNQFPFRLTLDCGVCKANMPNCEFDFTSNTLNFGILSQFFKLCIGAGIRPPRRMNRAGE